MNKKNKKKKKTSKVIPQDKPTPEGPTPDSSKDKNSLIVNNNNNQSSMIPIKDETTVIKEDSRNSNSVNLNATREPISGDLPSNRVTSYLLFKN